MKSQYRMLFVFLGIMLAVSLACSALGGNTPEPATDAPQPPTDAPQQPTKEPQQQPTPEPQQPTSNGNGLVTFTDGNNLLAFDLPGDWTYEHTDHGDAIYSDVTAYTDTFTAPDESAKIESLVMFANPDVEFNNSTSQAVALDILNTYYSSTGKNNGDIRISTTQIQNDGSLLFKWKSKGGNYSGASYFETRGDDKGTWLMFTAWWSNDVDQTMLDTIDAAIVSYRIP